MKTMHSRRAFITTTLATAAILPAGLAMAQSTEHAVQIKSFAFEPAVLRVKVGDTITFTNLDGAPHTATSENKFFGTKTLRKNKSETITVSAETAGGYFCKFHRNMKGTIEIVS